MTKKKNELEFESDKVKVYVQQIQAVNGILAQQLDQLKAHNEKLRGFQEYWSKVEQKNLKLSTQNEIYKQALQEIQEIAYELTNEEYTDFIEHKQKQILQKCEVLDGR